MSTMRKSPHQGAATTESDSKAWFLVPRPLAEPRVRLFCFAHAGGNAVIFHGWHRQVPADIEVRAVQLPGRANRWNEAPHVQVEELLDALLTALQPWMDVPFAFFGHSMGAMLAFELTRSLRRRGAPLPVHLFVSGRGAPQIPSTRPPLHQLPDDKFLEAIRRFGGLPEVVLENPELVAMVLPALRADFQLVDEWTYRPEAPLNLPLSAFGGDADRAVPHDELAAWAEQTTGPWEVDHFVGGHFYLQSHQAELVALVANRLQGAQGKQNSGLGG